MSNEPTLEDLQKQLIDLQNKTSGLELESQSFKEENKKLKESLSKARELNMSLFERIPVNSSSKTDVVTDEEEDTFDKLLDETINKIRGIEK